MSAGIKKWGHAQEIDAAQEATPGVVRARINEINKEIPRLALAFQYVGATRACEVCGRARGHEVNWPVYAEDMSRETYTPEGGRPVGVAVFRLSTAKREGIPRSIALPTDPLFEPFTEPLAVYMEEVGRGPAFPITRQDLHAIARKVFAGLYYPIEPYGSKVDPTKKASKENRRVVPRHYHQAGTHSLRHVRITELADYYGMTDEERAQYGGWTAAGAKMGIPSSLARYDMANWRRYFPRLLKPSPYPTPLRRGPIRR